MFLSRYSAVQSWCIVPAYAEIHNQEWWCRRCAQYLDALDDNVSRHGEDAQVCWYFVPCPDQFEADETQVTVRGYSSVLSCFLSYLLHFASHAFLMNWLANLSGKVDGFKEMDLLQEHQNFWAKVCSVFNVIVPMLIWLQIIYNAKGSNHS